VLPGTGRGMIEESITDTTKSPACRTHEPVKSMPTLDSLRRIDRLLGGRMLSGCLATPLIRRRKGCLGAASNFKAWSTLELTGRAPHLAANETHQPAKARSPIRNGYGWLDKNGMVSRETGNAF